jgi:beta-1,4-mannosyl-glycoprotein beta-1,4-N-acetylglucosaminyltransferase
MIYDCFSFCGEFELLDMRLRELDQIVDRFVLVESDMTHTGKPKPLYFEENKDRYKNFLNKIEYVKVLDLPVMEEQELTSEQTLWTAEHFQRNAMMRGLKNAGPDDLILISDVDEIPSIEAIVKTKDFLEKWPQTWIFFYQWLCYYYLNMRYSEYDRWYGTTACLFKTMKDPQTLRLVSRGLMDPVNQDTVRIENAGWHFSYLGGAQGIINKLDHIAEARLVEDLLKGKSVEEMSKDISDLKDPWRVGYLWGSDKYLECKSTPYMRRKYPYLFYTTKPKIEVISLVYKLTEYVDSIYNELINNYTNDSNYFVSTRIIANDPTPEVEKRVLELDIPVDIYHDPVPDAYYMKRVYRCYNYAVETSKADYVVLVNSDMIFSKDWLSNMLKNMCDDKVLTGGLVESGKLASGTYAISENYGRSPKEIDKTKWYERAEQLKVSELRPGGLYMPMLINRKKFLEAGKYPEGNLYPSQGQVIPGDVDFFSRLKKIGVEHFTVFDSWTYHIQEGELHP